MQVGRSEALAIFRTWLEDRTLLRFELRLWTVASTFNGRLIEATDTRLRIMSDDRWSEADFPLREDLEFEYTDMRSFPKEAKEFDHMIVVFFPFNGVPKDSEHVVITELREPIKAING